MTEIASNAQVAVHWVEREFATTNLIHGRDQERAGYSIIVRTSEDQLVTVNQLLMVTLLDEFLSDHTASEVALLLDVWEVGKTMRWAGPAQRVVLASQGLRVEPGDRSWRTLRSVYLHADCFMLWNTERGQQL